MKNGIRIATLVFFLATSRFAYAHPPKDIKLDYDLQKKILHIEMSHVVSHMRKHHIRKILISINDDSPAGPAIVQQATPYGVSNDAPMKAEVNDNGSINLTIVKQTTPYGFSEDIPIKAEIDDSIFVEALCSQGGAIEGSLVVSDPDQPAEEKINP